MTNRLQSTFCRFAMKWALIERPYSSESRYIVDFEMANRTWIIQEEKPMFKKSSRARALRAVVLALSVVTATLTAGASQRAASRFHLQEATIEGIQQAIRSGQVTTVG